ncbi:hypothetical protein CTA2_11438 [Colletotrichum tanaceti]|uniref:Uncharacterized protein n=1 Tax=Colletotrichum tanaceti TaxID=1306861 RepID=A0A4U6X2U6_9PEZI|nr:hypothetical protein CTA2_11438 [Colletotrichum tanaceti]TKW49692.1 hypothetical protein CTA1_10097 [Colletotrichum tanaceti]
MDPPVLTRESRLSRPQQRSGPLFEAQEEHRATRLRESHHLRYYLPGPIAEQVREKDREITARDGHERVVRIYPPVEEKPISKGARSSSCNYHEGG